MFFQIMRFGWVQFHIEISKVTGPNFTGLVSPNVGVIALERVTHGFQISSFFSHIFAAELWSRPNLAKFCMYFATKSIPGCDRRNSVPAL